MPAPALASEFQAFDLPSPLVDSAFPGSHLADGRTAPKVNVLLPDGYDPDSKRGYPVLWLLHGANGGTDSWLGNIAELTAGFPGIIVMPDGGTFGMYTDWWNDGARGAPSWATYHLNVFRDEIERRYPIRPGRRWHAIGGISMGGQGALRYAALLPGYFGSVAGFSAAVPDMQSEVAQAGLSLLATAGGAPYARYGAIFGPAHDAYARGNSPKALAPNYAHTRVYLTSGNGGNCPGDPATGTFALDIATETGLHAQQAPFARAVRAEGADVKEVTTCGVHTFGVWDRAIPAALRWGFFKPVPQHPRNWAYRTVAPEGEMWGLRFRFDAPPDRVARFERSGATLSGVGEGRVRIRGSQGCRVSAQLPFTKHLPRACTS